MGIRDLGISGDNKRQFGMDIGFLLFLLLCVYWKNFRESAICANYKYGNSNILYFDYS